MSGKMKIVFFCVVISVLAVLPGCSDSGRHSPIFPQYPGPPAITGMIFTDQMNNTLGIWGRPTSTLNAYPNPFCVYTAIYVWVQSNGMLQMYVVKGYGPGESYDPLVSSAGGGVCVPYGVPLRTMNVGVYAGIESIYWDGADDAGTPLPSGFYRIYIEVDNLMRWSDVYLACDCADIPEYLNAPKCDE